ncbi:aminodeoxychorismate/anthranilate synthase component II [uncultured Ilyobacter sp.]|uniref:anthranilate synthase component II n=1 Tax=uncultured Ilyobacter sp. TaxID=544433 RepID=UPI0029F584FC|nr:aminodeoxychorismate/anthranilate synthase component II [uncultured Ilyobacter sp.]
MILMIDNYDSFTYNLVQYLEQLGEEVVVKRNNEIRSEEVEKLSPQMIIISPGPCTPDDAGISLEVIEKFKDKIPILGICLGHQSIAQVFGGKIIKAAEPVHGKVHEITHSDKGVFKNLNNPLRATRYHSLIVEKETLPKCLEITAFGPGGEIMGLKHRSYLIEGVQFHPEAILTEQGLELLGNFLRESKNYRGCKC